VKILFVYPNITRQTTPQVGIASLISVILKKHDVRLFDLTIIKSGGEKSAFLENLETFLPDLVLVSCRSNEWGYVKKIVEWSYPIPVILGGIHPTINTEEVLEHAKMVIRGESEEALEELLDRLERGRDIGRIRNLWFKRRGRIVRNDVRPLIQNLDELPFPEWKAFPKDHFYNSYIKSLFKDIRCVGTFETTRGCPYLCSYCCNEYLQKIYKGKGTYHRKKSPQRVVSEIRSFRSLYPDCNFLYFVDDTFMVEGNWLEEFKDIHDKTPFVFMTRPEMVTREKMRLVAEAGGKAVSIGVESGNEKFRKEILNRKMSQEQIIEAFKIAKDFGLMVYSFNMVGLPYETREDILATIELNKKLKPDIAQFTIFFPFKGTKLFDICTKEGYLAREYPELFNYYNKSFLNHPNFKEGELEKWAEKAERIFKKKKK